MAGKFEFSIFGRIIVKIEFNKQNDMSRAPKQTSESIRSIFARCKERQLTLEEFTNGDLPLRDAVKTRISVSEIKSPQERLLKLAQE